MLRRKKVKCVSAGLFAASLCAAAADPLPALQAGKDLTVSGVSSGAYMAVQFHVAHSSVVKGAGAIAGGPYYCAQGSLWTAYYNCMTPGLWTPLPSPAFLKTETELLARSGQIDATDNLAQARVWLFGGRNDRTVAQEVVKSLGAYYTLHGAKPVLVTDKPAGHAMVTEKAGNDCSMSEPPYINHCDYDAAGELLKHLLGPLIVPGAQASGQLLPFDQRPYTNGDPEAISMANEGFVYVPAACEAGGCRVHVAFHGCRQSAAAIGERFVRDAGYNRWADTNRLIVLYPQTVARYFGAWNPRGCWDWWGYTGALYHTRSGAQMRAVKAMIDRLAAK